MNDIETTKPNEIKKPISASYVFGESLVAALVLLPLGYIVSSLGGNSGTAFCIVGVAGYVMGVFRYGRIR